MCMKKEVVVFHLISSTKVGGAEMMLEKFLKYHESAENSIVVSLTDVGAVGERLQKIGIPVVPLGIRSPFTAAVGLFRYLRLVRRHRPMAVVAWMYHANFLAVLVAVITRGSRVVWNVRCGLGQYSNGRLGKRVLLRLSCLLSFMPDRIVFNSKRSMQEHIEYGFQGKKCEVIYNGFFPMAYSQEEAVERRLEIGVGKDVFLIGCFGRNVRVKRMADLLDVCAGLRQRGVPAEVLYVGRDFDSLEFQEQVAKSGVGESVHVRQEVASLAPYYYMVDAFCLCSESEGFPNVIGEAVYSGVPVFCTDVGDMKNGFLMDWQVSPVGDIPSLIRSALSIFSMGDDGRRSLARQQLEQFREKTEMGSVVRKLGDAFFCVG